jgi:hypothetical protein
MGAEFPGTVDEHHRRDAMPRKKVTTRLPEKAASGFRRDAIRPEG